MRSAVNKIVSEVRTKFLEESGRAAPDLLMENLSALGRAGQNLLGVLDWKS